MPSTASRIKDFALGVAWDVVFTTGQLLSYGSRNAVDVTLCRLVRDGYIRRVADGTFVSAATDFVPTMIEIVKAKAERHCKSIVEGPEPGAAEGNHTFLTNGCRSSFRSVHGRLYLKHLSPKKTKTHLDLSQVSQPKPGESQLAELKNRESLVPVVIQEKSNESQILRLAGRLAHIVLELISLRKIEAELRGSIVQNSE